MRFNKAVSAIYLRYTVYLFLVLMSLTYLLGFYRLALTELIVLTIMMIFLYICVANKLEFKKVLHLVLMILSFVLMINGFVHEKSLEIVSFAVFGLYNAIMLFTLNKNNK
ncbi:MAG: hypothetical protein ACI4WM_01500 [Erysipelotrichaceae bacterium]